ncbi:MAG: ABC transporter permease [Nocardiopsis sp. BM-2018]|uniref:Transport permease protein n=1 Tax=Nocardiopsis metallicus TaxID=179819 RepID=A0A840WU03_9ACTN|nr:ABC transporter permease [Nocardiopsis metallicus]MBB5495485.1 ABC-2 type transport system permease protein [Nocardiopsis metallicus]QRN79108.1 MAG: ABC transporter permease [Nocardiopsis sp. BM-2018]
MSTPATDPTAPATAPDPTGPRARRAAVPTGSRGRLPGPLRVGLSRGWMEIRTFAREWESVIFTFSLPALILVMFASIFDGLYDMGIPTVDYYLPGIIAMGLMSVSFQTLGTAIAAEREYGTLRRLRGTPMPPSAYFVGKTVLVLFLAFGQLALLLAVAGLFFDANLPSTAQAWATIAWVLLLGTIGCSLLGIAISSLARTAQAASAVVVVPFLILQFTSGIFVPVMVLPDWVLNAASLFPLLWMAQGMRAGFFPDEMAALEQSGAWDLPMVALALGAWCVVGLVLTLLTFRWKTRKDG